MKRSRSTFLLVGLFAASALSYVACDSDSGVVKEPQITPDAGPLNPVDGGPNAQNDGGPQPDGGPGDCVLNPTTHLEILNACTDAVQITKNPVLPLKLADGGLPPVP
ncbi:MAG: hypothetical protein KF819_21990 [Labilithrix sp.]|nr:hypothetical protein [Labilithrix sp.]